MNEYGKLIEGLIWIKDHYNLTLSETDIINDTCNVLEDIGSQKE